MADRKKPKSRPAEVRIKLGRWANRALVWGVDVVLYARSSSDEQSRSVAQQIAAIEKYAKRAGWLHPDVTLPRVHSPEDGVYVDDGISGWKFAPNRRPGSGELLKNMAGRRRPADSPALVLTWALSRFGRFSKGAEECIYWLYRMRRRGLWLRSITQPDLDSNEKDRLMRIIQTALESEKDTKSSEEKSRTVGRGKLELTQAGLWHGGDAPFGYDRWAVRLDGRGGISEWVELLPGNKRNGNPNTRTVLKPNRWADLVRALFALIAFGENGVFLSLEKIAERWNADKVPTRLPKAKGWYHTSLQKVIANSAYRGVRVGSDGVEYRALWEPLVTHELFATANGRIARPTGRGRGSNSVYVLAGLISCVACGERLYGDTNDGVEYYRSKRPVPGGEACGVCRLRIRADAIEPLVLAQIPVLADHPVAISAVASEIEVRKMGKNRTQDQLGKIDAAIAGARQRIQNLVGLAAISGPAGEGVRAKLEEENKVISRAESEKRRLLAGRGTATPIADHVAASLTFASVFGAATPGEQKQLIGQFVVGVSVDIPAGAVTVNMRRPVGMAA